MEGEYSGHSDRLALMTVMADDKLSEKVAVDGPSIAMGVIPRRLRR